MVEAGTLRQQLSGTVKDAPPHRLRELFFAWTVKPDAGVVLDGPEPVPEREVVRVDVLFITPVTRQQSAPYSRVIRYLAIVKQGRLMQQQSLPLMRGKILPAGATPCQRKLFFKDDNPVVRSELGEGTELLKLGVP